MPRYRKKPVIVEAVRFGGPGGIAGVGFEDCPAWLAEAMRKPEHEAGAMFVEANDLCIRTLEGVLTASPGDWIIRGTAGEIYPCKPEIFAAIYDPADAAAANALYGPGNHRLGEEPGIGRTELTGGAVDA